jgi:hypothetical protein
VHFSGAPQVYPVCFQADVSSSGTFVPTDTVTFPEAYHGESLSLDYETFNVNNSDSQKFTCPGPAVVDFSKGGGTAPAASGATPSSAVNGPAESSAGGEVAAPSQSDSAPSGNTGSGNASASDAPIDQASDLPVSSQAPVASFSSANAPASSAPVQAISAAAVTGAASSASTTGRGRGRHTRRPGQPR